MVYSFAPSLAGISVKIRTARVLQTRARMKGLIVGILLGLAAFSARAIPTVVIDFEQTGNIINLQAELWDGVDPINAEAWHLNGVLVASGLIFAYGLNNFEIPPTLPPWLKFGNNVIVASYQGGQYQGEFSVHDPVPDGGATAGLLGLGMVAMWFVRRHLASHA